MAEEADQPADDQAIPGEIWALRRVHRTQVNNGGPDSSVFKAGREGIGTSVTLFKSQADLEILLAGYEGSGVIAIPVAAFRDHNLGIMYTFEEGNPNHCEVFGPRGRGAQRDLAKQARWVVRPEGLNADVIPELFTPPLP